METYSLDHDINLYCVKAQSFPDGIGEAHAELAALSAGTASGSHFGISYLYDDEILYLAAKELTGKHSQVAEGAEFYTLKKGDYISIYIADFAKDISQIQQAFKLLMEHPDIDENGCCAEWYLPEGAGAASASDVRCMIRLDR